ncbi:hypothetical protein K2173_027310 [Erythroxylum novogranatense]|uniref:Uncharacterized protein n=1 Tax=Erythroxylum novogranatense TaxID=1862640 RepID=A0AAV8U194_9ROSI|nr:hypothetical protein K2173_027310 [Erythroxylum novogranatense]
MELSIFACMHVAEHDKHKLDSVQVSARKSMIGETNGGNAKIDRGVEDLHAVNENLTGNNISGLSSIATSQKTTDMEEYVKKALSKLRFGSDDGEKAIDSSLEEDGFDIDYDPPHPHPPSHHRRGGGGKIQS